MKCLGLTTVFATIAALGLVGAAQAATVNGATSGLAGANTELAFDEVSLTTNDIVTDQFAAFGVTFSPNLVYYGNPAEYPNFTDPALGNFSPIVNPFFLDFTSNVTAATFAIVTNLGASTFTALLDGAEVESFSATTDLVSTANFFGFTDILFDQIRVDVGSNGVMFMDNLAFNAAPTVSVVPLPAGLPLLLGALGGFALLRRHRVT